jgi:DNA-binding transcriptional MerR regulator/effector-binding domain-containing protein
MQRYVTAGELSQLCNLHIQTLHYYDKIGLLKPSGRRAKDGARLYTFDQVYKLTTIRYQQRLGKSLAQIADYLASRDVTTTLDDLNQQMDTVHQKMAELKLVEKMLEEKIDFLQQKFSVIQETDPTKVDVIEFPPRFYVAAGGEEFQFGNDYFYVYPTVVFHEAGKKSFGVYVSEDFKTEHPLAQLSQIPGGRYFCAYHKGSYETIFTTIDALKDLAKQRGYSVSERSVCFNIIDQFLEPDTSNYLTEVQLQILS